MQDVEFKRFRSQVFALYENKAYAEALALIDEKGGAFPDFESDIFFWRACLAGRLGDGNGALEALRRAAQRGHWYQERMLRDPDLDIIRDTAELSELLPCSRSGAGRPRPRRERSDKFGNPRAPRAVLPGSAARRRRQHRGRRRLLAPRRGAGMAGRGASVAPIWTPGRYHWQDTAKATEEALELQDTSEEIKSSFTVLAGSFHGAGLAIRSALSGGPPPAQGFLAVAPSFRMEDITPLMVAAAR